MNPAASQVDAIRLFKIEIGSLLSLLLLSIFANQLASYRFPKAKRFLGRLARNKPAAILFIGLMAFAASSIMGGLGVTAPPRVHDEFSYLLQADTFSHFRLSNPAHPCSPHFESFHINQVPTYASKYPPAQGLILAIGKTVFKCPIYGVWFSFGLACAAICWMLQGWLPPVWALFGAFLAVIRLGFLGPAFPAGEMGYWSQSYWGGSMAALGGALVLGAFRRWFRGPRPYHGLLMGLGLAILANSRPYEGLLLVLPVLSFLVIRWFTKGPQMSHTHPIPCLLLLCVVLALCFTWMGYYNWRVTGNPWRLPYQAYEETYGVTPVFVWQSPRPVPTLRHKAMRDFQVEQELPKYQDFRHWDMFVAVSQRRVFDLYQFFVGFLFLPAVATFPWILRDRWGRLALSVASFFLVGLLMETWLFPHYAAPITALVFFFLVQGLRHLRFWKWRGRPIGLFLVKTLPLGCLGLTIWWIGQKTLMVAPNWSVHRTRLLSELEQRPGRHLVFVHYGYSHRPDDEWVYNEADIDNAKVIWAREMDNDSDQTLINYFRNRSVWLVDADNSLPRARLLGRGNQLLLPVKIDLDAMLEGCLPIYNRSR